MIFIRGGPTIRFHQQKCRNSLLFMRNKTRESMGEKSFRWLICSSSFIFAVSANTQPNVTSIRFWWAMVILVKFNASKRILAWLPLQTIVFMMRLLQHPLKNGPPFGCQNIRMVKNQWLETIATCLDSHNGNGRWKINKKKLCKDCLFPWSRISGFKDSITNKSHIDLILFEKTRTWFFGFSEVMALNFATLPLGMTNSKLKGVPAVPMSRVCRLRRVGFLIRGKRRLYAHLHMGNVGWLSSLMIKEYEHVFLLRTKHICAHPPRFALVILELPPSHMPRDGPQQ